MGRGRTKRKRKMKGKRYGNGHFVLFSFYAYTQTSKQEAPRYIPISFWFSISVISMLLQTGWFTKGTYLHSGVGECCVPISYRPDLERNLKFQCLKDSKNLRDKIT